MFKILNISVTILFLLVGSASFAGEMNKIDQVVREVVQTKNSWGQRGEVLQVQEEDISELHFVHDIEADCFVVVGGKALHYDFQVCVNKNKNQDYEGHLL